MVVDIPRLRTTGQGGDAGQRATLTRDRTASAPATTRCWPGRMPAPPLPACRCRPLSGTSPLRDLPKPNFPSAPSSQACRAYRRALQPAGDGCAGAGLCLRVARGVVRAGCQGWMRRRYMESAPKTMVGPVLGVWHPPLAAFVFLHDRFRPDLDRHPDTATLRTRVKGQVTACLHATLSALMPEGLPGTVA